MSWQALNYIHKIKTGSVARKSVLKTLANFSDARGGSFPSIDAIMEDSELSVRGVQKALKELEEMGIVNKILRTTKNGKSISNYYVIVGLAESMGEQPISEENSYPPTNIDTKKNTGRGASRAGVGVNHVRGRGASRAGVGVNHVRGRGASRAGVGVHHVHPQKCTVHSSTVPTNDQLPIDPNLVNSKSRGKTKHQYPSTFESLWREYPRNAGSKYKAKLAWDKALKFITHDYLMQAVKSFTAHHQKAGTESKFIPHLTTYLNGRRWEVPIETEQPKPRSQNSLAG